MAFHLSRHCPPPAAARPAPAPPRVPKLAALMDDAEAEMLAYRNFPAQRAHHMSLETIVPLGDDPTFTLPAQAA